MPSAASAVCLFVLALMSAHVAPHDTSCPQRCRCSELIMQCHGCPTDLALTNSTQSLSITDCTVANEEQMRNNDTLNDLSLMVLKIVNSNLTLIETLHRHVFLVESLTIQQSNMTDVTISADISKLKYLDLSNNNITLLQRGAFEKVKKLLHLNLNSNKLKEMKEGCFNNLRMLTYLDLSQNNLTALGNVLSGLPNLQQLNLSYNNLESLSEGCFNNLTLLQHLDISYNQLTEVAPGALQFLPNLAQLLLTDNPELGAGQLEGQFLVSTGRRLQQVDASRTGLSQVPEALTHSVRFLALVGNNISYIECGHLDSYPLLQTLDFSENTLYKIEDDALGRSELLSELHLNRNMLRSIPKMLPDELQYLSICNNLLGNISMSDFVDLLNLKVLLLGNNLITYIQENVFIQLISLEELDLSSNPLMMLTPNTFNGPLSLRHLRLSFLNVSLPAKDVTFPLPSPEWLHVLQLDASPGLARQLLADSAVLAAMSRLQYLDLRYNDLSVIRTDLLHYLSQLKVLRLHGNDINCTSMDWLRDWMIGNASKSENETCYFSALGNGEDHSDIESTKQFKIYNSNKKFNIKTNNDSKLTNDKIQKHINMKTLKNSSQSINTFFERKTHKTLSKVNIDGQHNSTWSIVANKITHNEITSKLAYIFGASTDSKQIEGNRNNTQNGHGNNIIERLERTSESYTTGNISSGHKQLASHKMIESNVNTRINQENAIRLLDVSSQRASGNSERDYQAFFSITEKSTKYSESSTSSSLQISKNAKTINKAIVKNVSDTFLPRISQVILLNPTSKDKKKGNESNTIVYKHSVILPHQETVVTDLATKKNNDSNFTKGEWSPYSAEKIHSSAYQYTAIVVFMCLVISACAFAWWSAMSRRSRQPRQIRLKTPPEDHIEVSSISGGSGLLW